MIVEQFLRWMDDAPDDRRAEATSALARAYLHSTLSEGEREAAEAALTLLLDDPCVRVRRALAEALARSEDAPREVILALVSDLPQIATTVLRHSPVLLDAELVDVVAGHSDPLPVAVASRSQVSVSVAAAIAEVGSLNAGVALVGNEGADISRLSLIRLVERHGKEAALREALLTRGDVPIEIRQMLLKQVGDLLSDHPLVRRGLNEDRARTVVAEARERATVSLANCAAPHETEALVEHLRQSGQLTAGLLLRGVCTGNAELFQTALVRLSGLSRRRVASVLSSGRSLPLRALLGRAGLPSRTHSLFCVAVSVWRDLLSAAPNAPAVAGSARVSRLLIGEVIARYQAQDGVEADDLVVMLRRFSAEIAREAARDFRERTLAA
ncbi:DUF2336 domain-containing protein [Stappia sp.]|uniref:DUF2336 domain-containing protein n=1 Tax=Stappia sp. TaxID=1870903 RepID=UPI003A99251C